MTMTSEDIDFMLFSGKTCICCGQTFPANSEHFQSDKTRPDGLRSQCRACRREAGRVAYQRDPGKYVEKVRRYRQRKAAR